MQRQAPSAVQQQQAPGGIQRQSPSGVQHPQTSPGRTQQPASLPQQQPAARQAPAPAQQGQPGQQITPANVPPPAANVRKLDDFRSQRRETRQGDAVIIQEPGRTIVREGGRLTIQRNDSERFTRSARNVRTERQGQGIATIVERPNGVRVVNVTDDNGRLLRRVRRDPSGREIVIIDNTRRGGGGAFVAGAAVGAAAALAGVAILNMAPPVVRIPRERYIVEIERAEPVVVYETLMAPPVEVLERDYSFDEIRYNAALRDRMPRVDIDTITFETGSWEIGPDQARRLQVIADAMLRAIERDPSEVFLIEGYTDAVGLDVDNLSLSDRRAESVAQVLTEEFNVPPENLTTQGYGEQYLKIPTDGPERRNRRVTVRRITPLLNGPLAQR
jgi:outer membrane protein OmpA-like peptidoglycan-associated protein